MFKRIISLILLLLNLRSPAQESCPKLMDFVQTQLPHHGIIKHSKGFVFVDVDDAYIHQLIPFIQEEGFVEPPYFGNADLVGAHITIIYPEEVKAYGIEAIEEEGEVIHFTPKKCKIVYHKRNGMEAAYFIIVEAPELDQIREKYGLPKREYDLHITIGIK